MTTMRGVATIGAVAVFGAVSTAVLAPTASGDDTIYTVMAYSRSTGAIGWASNYPDLSDASVRAMHECENHPTHPSTREICGRGFRSLMHCAGGQP